MFLHCLDFRMCFTASSLPFLTPTFFPIVPPRSAAELPIGGQVAQGILEDLVANTRQEVAWAALSAFTGASPLGVPAQKASGARVIGTGLNFLSGSGLAAFGGGGSGGGSSSASSSAHTSFHM